MVTKACLFNIQKYSLHDGPGIRTVVFFKGCPLRCYWCANPESQASNPELMWDNQRSKQTEVGYYQSVEEIMTEVMKDQVFYDESHGGVTLSGGEVLYQGEFAIELLKALKREGIHRACETTGYAKSELFDLFIQEVDLLYFDVKHYEAINHQKGIGVSNKLILDNLQRAVNQSVNLIVRIPVIPNYNDRLDDAKAFAQLFQQMGVTEIELLPFHQFGEQKYQNLERTYLMEAIPQLHSEDLREYQEVIEEAGIRCLVR